MTCIGAMFEKLGRMMGRSYEDTVQILLKTLRNAESQLRIQIMITLEKVAILTDVVYIQANIKVLVYIS